MIEHNLEVVKTAGWIIDLGPEGGDAGGEIVAAGPPEDLARVRKSWHPGGGVSPLVVTETGVNDSRRVAW